MSEAGRVEAMWRWLEGSAFVVGGKPIVLYHGTDIQDPFNIFTRWEGEASIGFHFGTKEVANSRITEIFRMESPEERGGIIIPVLCRARNPLRLPDQYMWDQWDVASALYKAGVLANEDEVEFVADSCSAEMLFAAIEEAGYDCVVYGNECEHKPEVTDSFVLWRSEFLKSPYAAGFDLADPRLLPQNPTPDADFREWERLSRDIDDQRRKLAEFRQTMPAPTAP